MLLSFSFSGFAGWFALLALVLTPASQTPRPMSFTATLNAIRVNARPGQVITRQFQLTLDPGQPTAHFKAKVEDWWRSQDGAQSHYAAAGTLQHSCATWTSINPVESAVAPAESLSVRISVSVPKELAPGGYWCALTVDQLPDPLSADAGVGVRFVASVSTGIFIDVDPVDRKATIEGIRTDNERAVVTVRNRGNAPLGIDGQVQFLRPGGSTPVATIDIPRTTVLTEPIMQGDLAAALPSSSVLPSGRYIVRVVLDIGAAQDIGAEQELVIARAASPNGAGR